MPVHAWESFVERILSMALNAAQSMIRIALIVAVAYVIMKLMRAAFYRLETFVIHATEKTEMVPGAAAKFPSISGVSAVLQSLDHSPAQDRNGTVLATQAVLVARTCECGLP